jgi:hypothetical protein
MEQVYIAHPLNAPTRQEILENLRRASFWTAWAARRGVAPVAPYIALASVWEETPENRALGIAIDKAVIRRCGALWLTGGRISTGMHVEADYARLIGIPIVDLTSLGSWPPTEMHDAVVYDTDAEITGRK